MALNKLKYPQDSSSPDDFNFNYCCVRNGEQFQNVLPKCDNRRHRVQLSQNSISFLHSSISVQFTSMDGRNKPDRSYYYYGHLYTCQSSNQFVEIRVKSRQKGSLYSLYYNNNKKELAVLPQQISIFFLLQVTNALINITGSFNASAVSVFILMKSYQKHDFSTSASLHIVQVAHSEFRLCGCLDELVYCQ